MSSANLNQDLRAKTFPAIPRKMAEKSLGRWSAMYDEKLQRVAEARRDRTEEVEIAKEEEKAKAIEAPHPRRLQALVWEHLERMKELKVHVRPLSKYPGHRQHQILCFFCTKACLSDSVPCQSCSSVAHRLCLDVAAKQFDCPVCIESHQQEIQLSEDSTASLEEVLRVGYYTERLGERMLAFMRRTLYKRKKACIVKLQAVVRLRLARKNYILHQAQQLRGIVIEILEIPKLNLHTGLVILSIFDAASKMQMSRAEKTPVKALQEAFLIPGISAYSMIVLTFCTMDAVNCQQYNIVGQTVMSLRDYPQFKNNMDFEFHIEISTRINWVPCAHEELSDIKYKLTTPITTETILRDTTCWMRIKTLRPTFTLCCGFNGPSLMHFHKAGDKVILREKEKLGALKSLALQSEVKSARRYWLCCFDLHCYVYREATDLNPRFFLNLSSADVDVSKAIQSGVCIVFGDNKSFIFEFDNNADSTRFMYIFSEGKLAITGNTRHSKTLKDKRPFGHTAHIV